MKKLFLLVICLLSINVYGADSLNELKIEYLNNSITTSSRSYSNDRYIFKIDYLGDVTNFSSEQLNFALKQKSNDYLKIFGDIKVTVVPDPNGKFKNISSNVFVGYAGGMFGNSLTETVMPNDTARKEGLSFTVKNPIMEVYYRTTDNGAWINTKDNLSGELSVEEQLAKLLNIDLSSNPNGVKDKYKTLYYFKPYEDSVYTNRFDFYDSTSTTPANEENSYEINTLSKISTEYALLKFDYPSTGAFLELQNKTSNLPYIIVVSILVCLGAFYGLKRKGII